MDLLADHKDLTDAVANLEITRDRAVELATHRQRQQAERAQRESADAHQRGLQEFESTVNNAAKSMESYLKTREAEVDHPARMKALGQRFADPKFMQQFVSTYKPEQWGVAVQMLYDGITVPRAAPTPQPMRANASRLGSPQPNGSQAPIDRMAARLDSMGI